MTPRSCEVSPPGTRHATRRGRCRCGATCSSLRIALTIAAIPAAAAGFESDDDDFVAATNAERHQRHGAARAGAAAASAQFDFVGQALGDARDLCCRAARGCRAHGPPPRIR